MYFLISREMDYPASKPGLEMQLTEVHIVTNKDKSP